MDKQNEGIQDPGEQEIPYDMGGWAAIRSWGKRRPIIAEQDDVLLSVPQTIRNPSFLA
jgi:hypothetical protein